MAVDVLLPKLGLTMSEATVEEWLVQDGDQVAVGDPLMRLATDKVDVEIEAETAGRFYAVVPCGVVCKPGAVVARILGPADVAEKLAPSDGNESAESAMASVTDVPNHVEDAMTTAVPTVRHPASSPYARARARVLDVDLATTLGTGPRGRIVARDVEGRAAEAVLTAKETLPVHSPLVRRDAERLRVSLRDVAGTGPGGRIRRGDLPAADTKPFGGESTYLVGMRGAIAESMTQSLHEMAQLTLGLEADVTALAELREQLRSELGHDGLRAPTVNDFVLRATATALRRHPALNARIEGDAIVPYGDVNLGTVVSVAGGLLVPVIRNADRLSLSDLAVESRRLAVAVRDGGVKAKDLEGATFAVSSLGSFDIDFFTPVINPGNVGILGVGRIKDGVRWEDDVPRRTRVLTLSLTFDHRALDGVPAAEFVRDVAGYLHRPLRMLGGV
jgi:pyruvate/2-oxoglutarate dehydrogenase complex dihydrolipoamide acyltransferase (E2) component